MMHIEVPSVFLDILDGSLDGGVTASPTKRNRPNHCSAGSPGGCRARGQRHFRHRGGSNVNSQQPSSEHPLGFNLGKWLEAFQKAANGQEEATFYASAKTGNANSQQSTEHPLGNLGKWLEAIQKVANSQEDASPAAASTKTGQSPQTSTTDTRADVFRHRFDLKSFSPAEITVKMDGSTLVVQGKHEATEEDGTYECREYLKKVTVPENVLVEQMKCKLDELDGHLLIEAPLKKVTEETANVWTIPIEFVEKEAKNQDQEMNLD